MDILRRVRLFIARRRRIIAALCVGLSVLILGQGIEAGDIDVVVAANEIQPGIKVSEADIELRRFPKRLVPEGSLNKFADVVGKVLNSPVGAGEPITRIRFQTEDVELEIPFGQVIAPVRIDDPAALAGARAGDVINVVALGGEEQGKVVARRVKVVSVNLDEENGFTGYLVNIAVSEEQATELATLSTRSAFSFVVIPNS